MKPASGSVAPGEFGESAPPSWTQPVRSSCALGELRGRKARHINATTDGTAIWVTSQADGQVSRIDPATNRVVATLGVGREPRHCRVGFGSIWVTNYGSATVSRIDPVVNEVVGTVDVQFGPEGVAFTDDVTLVANGRSGQVSIVDPRTNRETQVIDTGAGSEGLFTAVDGTVWLTVTFENSVVSLDLVTMTVRAPLETGNEPRRIVELDGQLWVTNIADNTLSVIDPPLTPYPLRRW